MCIHKRGDGTCIRHSSGGALWWCVGMRCPDYVVSKVDSFRNMTDSELADFICENNVRSLCEIVCGDDCKAFAKEGKSPRTACREVVMEWLRKGSTRKLFNPPREEYEAEWCGYMGGRECD